jgi:hypothetical protein
MGPSRRTRPVKILAKGANRDRQRHAAMPRRAGHRLLARRNRWRWPLTRLRATQNDRPRVGATPPPDTRLSAERRVGLAWVR